MYLFQIILLATLGGLLWLEGQGVATALMLSAALLSLLLWQRSRAAARRHGRVTVAGERSEGAGWAGSQDDAPTADRGADPGGAFPHG